MDPVLEFLQNKFGEAHFYANKNEARYFLIRAKEKGKRYDGLAFIIVPMTTGEPPTSI